MSTDSQRNERIKWLRNIAANFSRLSRVHERYIRQTDGLAIAYSEREREFTFAICYRPSAYISSVITNQSITNKH